MKASNQLRDISHMLKHMQVTLECMTCTQGKELEEDVDQLAALLGFSYEPMQGAIEAALRVIKKDG